MAEIVDIEEIAVDYFWNTFKKTKPDWTTKLDFKDANIVVDWENVKFSSSKPKFTDDKVENVPQLQVLFHSTYTNKTDTDQEHKVHTERSSVSTCSTEIKAGFTKGLNLGLKLAFPGKIAELTTNFGSQVTMETTKNNCLERSLSWSVDNNLKVPRKKSVTVSMGIKEKEYSAAFKFDVTIRGRVRASIHNVRDNNSFVMSVDADFAEIMRDHMRRNGSVKPSYVIENRDVVWTVQGHCHIRSGVEQEVTIT